MDKETGGKEEVGGWGEMDRGEKWEVERHKKRGKRERQRGGQNREGRNF